MSTSTDENTLFTITARDIMTQSVLPASIDWSVKDLAEFLVANGISGAPVLDSSEQLVGVVSVTDIARHTSVTNDEADICDSHHYYTDALDFQFDEELIHEFGESDNSASTVRDIMTPKVHDVDIGTALQQVCADMVSNRIHRVFVSDNHKIVGVISALDILAVIRG